MNIPLSKRGGPIISAVTIAVCSCFVSIAQNRTPEDAWQYSVSNSIRLSIREKEGRPGSLIAQFIVTAPAGEQYSAQRIVGTSQFAHAYFPQDFGTLAKPGRHTWMCVVDNKIVAGGHFDYVELNDYARQEMPLAELEREKERFEREREAEYESGKLDEYLWVKVRAALAAEDELGDGINVEVQKGVVILSGRARNVAQKAKAEQIARSVTGIKAVKNQIRVSPSK